MKVHMTSLVMLVYQILPSCIVMMYCVWAAFECCGILQTCAMN